MMTRKEKKAYLIGWLQLQDNGSLVLASVRIYSEDRPTQTEDLIPVVFWEKSGKTFGDAREDIVKALNALADTQSGPWQEVKRFFDLSEGDNTVRRPTTRGERPSKLTPEEVDELLRQSEQGVRDLRETLNKVFRGSITRRRLR
jgi:hypothetical protein